ncbi:MAG TPA: dTMP kinase [Verrucomicrobiota bacterium]|nr:dTMP kinase [Verrucomicrobiota bacterium]
MKTGKRNPKKKPQETKQGVVKNPQGSPNPTKKGKYRNYTNVLSLAPSERKFYGAGIPGVDLKGLRGKLIVVEGADGSGRSTQIAKLVNWLEDSGHATVQVGLHGSTLVSEELERAKMGNILSHRTMSLFYATDFADQLENVILPALRSGRMVLADRYIYTLMARDLVRGMDEKWVRNLYGIALEPDAVFYLNVSSEKLIERNFLKNRTLDYWESGIDLGLSQDWFESFIRFQKLMMEQYRNLQKIFSFTIVDANHRVEVVYNILRKEIEKLISAKK